MKLIFGAHCCKTVIDPHFCPSVDLNHPNQPKVTVPITATVQSSFRPIRAQRQLGLCPILRAHPTVEPFHCCKSFKPPPS